MKNELEGVNEVYICEKRGRSVPRFIKQASEGEREREERFGLTITDLFPGEWEVRDEVRSGGDVDDGPGQCLHVDQRY